LVVRDEYQIVPGRWVGSLAMREEYHSLSGWNWQPSARLLWTPRPRHSLWAAVSRAVRTPARADRSLELTNSVFEQQGMLAKTMLVPNPGYRNENALSYEAGWRTQQGKRWLADAALFYTLGSDMRTSELASLAWTTVGARNALLARTQWANGGKVDSFGAEFFAQWQATRSWRVFGSYSALESRVRQWSGMTRRPVEMNPEHQGQVRMSFDLPRRVGLDLRAYAIGRIGYYSIPGHLRLESSVSWRPTRSNEFLLAIGNLTGRRQIEMVGQGPIAASVLGRTAMVRWTREF
jgi:iron complex outermembrane recepter protein